MSLNSVIFGHAFYQYRQNYLNQYKGYVDLLSVTAACQIEITNKNSSLVNPFTNTVFGDALKSCITDETLKKLKVVDPIKRTPLQIVLVGSELYINPFFRFVCQQIYLNQDVVLLGAFGGIEKEKIKSIVSLLGRRIVDKPNYDTLTICNTRRESKKRTDCLRFENDFYSVGEYLSIWKATALKMYL